MLCLAAATLGNDREIFFPALDAGADLIDFAEIARRFVIDAGYEPVELESEDEARERAEELIQTRRWPCYFFKSDTSGEKPFEEFYDQTDTVDWDRFGTIGVIDVPVLSVDDAARAASLRPRWSRLRTAGRWDKSALVTAIKQACPDLNHIETGASLDNKM